MILRNNRGQVRKVATFAAGVLMLILTIGGSASVGAAAPVPVVVANGYGVPYAYTYGAVPYVGVPYVGAPYIAANYGVVPGVVSYIDPRYCGDGRVSIVPDGSGNLINVCTSSGVRIFPVYADGYPYGAPYVVYR